MKENNKIRIVFMVTAVIIFVAFGVFTYTSNNINRNLEEVTKENVKAFDITNPLTETNKYAIRLDNFEGPLDLLCHLVDKNKMDIHEVNISKITDQYIEYINAMKELNLDVTSEFVLMASTLLFIKSKS